MRAPLFELSSYRLAKPILSSNATSVGLEVVLQRSARITSLSMLYTLLMNVVSRERYEP
jgi:predicted thioesterase